MKVYMEPKHGSDADKNPSGIQTVIIKYEKYLPAFGIELVDHIDDADVVISHAGILAPPKNKKPFVAVCHGLYWTADYNADKWEFGANYNVIENLRLATRVTAPSSWVADTISRDMRITSTVIGHGVELDEWKHTSDENYILAYGKNRIGDVCDPSFIPDLASRFSNQNFVATLGPKLKPSNVTYTGVIPHNQFAGTIKSASVVLSTTKETFGVLTLEAMASGKPILGYAHGGNLDIIQHGVNGYLARANDIDDLAIGLEYCLKNKIILGKNSIELAKSWTWDVACSKLYNVLKSAIESFSYKERVAVIIPAYNYARNLERVVGSCLGQTHKPNEIIIVDDGSTDNTREVSERLAKSDPVIRYIRQDNSGVAIARNTGVENSTSEFILCIDADDMIEPQFIEACYKELHENINIGIAYTGLRWVKQDGSTGMSQWPDEFNYDKQLEGKNQIPTCALMRREIWEKLGGQRQRYAPLGAGSEDANFWLRAGSIGYNAKKVTDAGLFVYSWGTGYVSGNKDYHEVDWRGMHPWVKDGIHPFASVASAEFYSHKVHQYDKPSVSVIIPIGSGHEKELVNALDSVESQTFRDWEAVVVWDSNNDIPKWMKAAYPFVKFIKTPKPSSGPSVARNMGVAVSKSPFVVFLDADDSLFPEALQRMFIAYKAGDNAIIYTDYVSKSYWDSNRLGELGDRILDYNEKKSEVVYKCSSQDYDCEKAQRQPERNPYHWCLVTCLIPKKWHYDIGGFDESMVSSFEDVDYHWRMALAGKCYRRINENLVVYRFDTGTRRANASFETNRKVGEELLGYMERKYKEIKKMGCKTCGQTIAVPQSDQVYGTRVMSSSNVQASVANDTDYIEITFVSDNLGDQPIYGTYTRKFYGYRSPGDVFLMHKIDIAQMPDRYIVAQQKNIAVEEQKALVPQAPVELSKFGVPIVITQDISVVPGVSENMKLELDKLGYKTVSDLKKITDKELLSIPGIGAVRAKAIIEWLKNQ